MTDKTLHSKENRIKIAKAKLLDTQRESNNLKSSGKCLHYLQNLEK